MAPWGDPHGLMIPARAGPFHFSMGPSALANMLEQLADDVVNYLKEIGTNNRRVAVEYINPSIIRAFLSQGLEVIDGVLISEPARVIKSPDEINCIRRAVAVAEHWHRPAQAGAATGRQRGPALGIAELHKSRQ